jgi:XTP/dITP diphosphohydrolase
MGVEADAGVVRIVVATSNPGKLAELERILDGLPVELVPMSAFDLDSPVEDGDTFEANALIKARAASNATGLPALADDSGLEVDALDGAPGVHSARYAALADDAADVGGDRDSDDLANNRDWCGNWPACRRPNAPPGSSAWQHW